MEPELKKRFSRQTILQEVGSDGQDKIMRASVLVIGAGGLGCPLIQYLGSAGIGTLGIVDFDRVEESNLPRQWLYTDDDLGKNKAEIAAEKISISAPFCKLFSYPKSLDNGLAAELFPQYDVIADCTDMVEMRYLINDACRIYNKPWVHGSVDGFEARWAMFNVNGGPDYRDAFPVPPNPMNMVNCSTRGVLGTVSGTAGTLMAMMVLKWILNPNKDFNSIHQMNLITNEKYEFFIEKKAREMLSEEAFLKLNYPEYMIASHYNKEITDEKNG